MKQKQHSSFWIGQDILDNAEREGSDVMALASYRKAIANFVNILTGRTDIKVTFDAKGGDSYTDGKTVVISSKIDEKLFDPTVGLALHEGSHCLLTDFESLKYLQQGKYIDLEDTWWLNYCNRYGCATNDVSYPAWIATPIIKDLVNVIEDRRIDNYVMTTAPGYMGYYTALYDKYFNSTRISKGLKSSEYRTENWDSYFFRIINITNKDRDLRALKALPKVWQMLDLANIGRLESTMDAVNLAVEIFKLIEDTIETDVQQRQQNNGGQCQNQDQDQNGGQGEAGEGESGDESGGGSMSSNGAETETDETTYGGGDETETTDDETETDETTDGGGATETTDDETETDEVGNGGGDATDDDETETTETTDGDGDLSERQKELLDKDIQKQRKFLNGEITKKKVTKKEKEAIEALTESGCGEVNVGKEGDWMRDGKTIGCVVIKKLTKKLIQSQAFPGILRASGNEWRNRQLDARQEIIQKGLQLGVVLGKRLKVRSEERSLTTPRMKSGKIMGSLLHEIGGGNFNVFSTTEIDKAKPALLHISIDASGSMHGKPFDNCQIAAVAIAKAASMTNNMDVMISYRGVHYGSTDKPLMLIAYDSRVDKINKIKQLFKHIDLCGSTPEGLCYEAVMKELVKTNNGTDTYLINFSDGLPCFSVRGYEYYGSKAREHTGKIVKKIRNAGVKILSYYVSNHNADDRTKGNFREMYGNDSEFINVNSILELAKSLNKRFQ